MKFPSLASLIIRNHGFDLLHCFLLHQQPRREAILEVVLALLALGDGGLGLKFFHQGVASLLSRLESCSISFSQVLRASMYAGEVGTTFSLG